MVQFLFFYFFIFTLSVFFFSPFCGGDSKGMAVSRTPFWKGAPWLALEESSSSPPGERLNPAPSHMSEAQFRQLVAEARRLEGLETNALLKLLRAPAQILGHYTSGEQDLCRKCRNPQREHVGDRQNCFSPNLCAEIAGWLLAGEAPDEWLDKAKSLSLSTTCGHVFKEDDWAYRCNNCATDPTCCVCAACFKESSCHEFGHKYVFFRTSAGGCCDCGDVQAWKSEGFCTKHRHSGSSSPTPEETAIAEQVPSALLNFLIDLTCESLLHENTGNSTHDAQQTFITCLFNDDVHDMLSVQNAVQRAGFPRVVSLLATRFASTKVQILTR